MKSFGRTCRAYPFHVGPSSRGLPFVENWAAAEKRAQIDATTNLHQLSRMPIWGRTLPTGVVMECWVEPSSRDVYDSPVGPTCVKSNVVGDLSIQMKPKRRFPRALRLRTCQCRPDIEPLSFHLAGPTIGANPPGRSWLSHFPRPRVDLQGYDRVSDCSTSASPRFFPVYQFLGMEPRMPKRTPEYCCAMASKLYKGTMSSNEIEHHQVSDSSPTVPQVRQLIVF